MNREELKLETEHLDLQERLAKAKAAARDARDKHGDAAKLKSPKAFEELDAAKAALSEFRVAWRGVRDAFAGAPEGTARPAVKSAKAKGN